MMHFVARLFLLLAALPPGLFADAEPFDFILRNGRIVDGTGNPSFHGDIAVKGGRIVAIGKIAHPAKQEFDAAHWIVAPGFIDVHTHAEDIDDLPLGRAN